MGIKANSLRYRSKRDGEIIVGSEIRAALDELENENSELRAQLARCVQALETYRKSFEDGFASSSILDSLPEQAKATAEVLRCAEEETELHKVGVDNVVFEPFVGVGPRSFFNLFSMNSGSGYPIKRKNKNGAVVDWSEENGRLRMQMLPCSYLERETLAANLVKEYLEKNDENNIAKKTFMNHLNLSKKIVQEWPTWKKTVIGSISLSKKQ